MKEQHILLFSDHRRPVAELPVRPDDRYRLTYCASDNRDANAIDSMQQRFDWILIDGAEMGGDQKEFFRLLRAIGLLLSERGTGYCSGLLCQVEWNQSGVLQLRCSRRHALGGEGRSPSADLDTDIGSFTFEYHAPMEKTG
jgi:hypothetical protein